MEVWGKFLKDSSVRFTDSQKNRIMTVLNCHFNFCVSGLYLIQAYEEKEIHRLVYFGGVAPSLRKEVWPFLLGHYQFTMTEKCRLEVFLHVVRLSKVVRYTMLQSLFTQAVCLFQIDEQMRTMYEQTMKDWQGCEAIVRQREREKHAEALARCSSGASVERGPVQRDSTISTDASLTF